MNNEQPKKNRVGRPFKMPKWLNELRNVLEETDDVSMLFLTDNDLLFLVNKKLQKEDRIDRKTFGNWKAGKFAPDEEIGQEFLECMQDAFIKQRKELAKRFMNETAGNWQKISWIMERKFSEWNLKFISETTNKNEQSTTIQITAGNEEQKALIESIMNVDFTEIKPLEIPIKKEVEQTDNIEDEELPF